MKKLIAVAIIVISFSQYTKAQNYGLGNTDPSVFTKYRVPETKLSSLLLNTNLNFSENKSEMTWPTMPGENNYQSNFQYSLSPKYYFLNEDDDNHLSFNVDLDGSYQYNLSEENGQNTRKTKNNELFLSLNGLNRNYLVNSNLFYSIKSLIQLQFSETYRDYPSNYQYDPYTGSKNQNYSVSFGIGWGKIRNVTPVVSAIRLQERLKQLSIINNDLSENAITEIAGQYSRQGYYSSIHNRPDKYFWDDLEKTLKNNNISLDGINQYGSSYLREIPNEIRFVRNEGIIYGVNVRFDYFNNYSSQRDYTTKVIEEFSVLGEAYLNFSRQMNLNSQLSFDLSLRGGPNIIENAYARQSYFINMSVRYDYELTDRLVVSIEDMLETTFRNSTNLIRNIYNNLNINFNYFLEDHISLNANASWNYTHVKYADELKDIRNYKNIMVGLTYYFDRGFIIK